MKLLFDENLAARLVRDIQDLFPDSAHVAELGLTGGSDREIWTRAGNEGFVLVTKDEDFYRLSVLVGPPPKVVWIRLGNCDTADVARVIRFRVEDIRAFLDHPEAAFLELG